MSRQSRGSSAVTLSAVSGLLCLVTAGLMWMGTPGQVAAAPLRSVGGPAPVAVTAPAVGTATTSVNPQAEDAAPGFRTAVSSGVAGGAPRALLLTGRPEVSIDPVGVTPDRGIDIPTDPARAGWWAAGSAPGDMAGTAVLVGHLDSAAYGLGAFAALLDVALGDEVTVRDSAGTEWSYVVTGREQMAKKALPASVFTTTGPARLVLITCGGRFDPVARHYDDNIVVTAEPQPAR